MLVIGAMGAAKDLLHVLERNGELQNLAFYDDVTPNIGDQLFNTFPILHSAKEAQEYFKTTDHRFTIGIGNPISRKKMYDRFISLGGKITSTISIDAEIGKYAVIIEDGCNIASGVILTSDIVLSKGVFVNTRATLTHDCRVGQFTEISPGVCIAGNCTIGEFSFIGTNATLLPKVNIGNNAIVAAGATVTKDVPDNCLVAGTPAVIKRRLN